MSETKDDAAALDALTAALTGLMERGKRVLGIERLAALQAAADADGETEYVVVLKMPRGRPIEGAAHIVKRLPDMPAIISPVFGFSAGEFAAVVVMGDGDEDVIETMH